MPQKNKYLHIFQEMTRKKLGRRLGYRPEIRAAVDTSLTSADIRVSRAGDGYLIEAPKEVTQQHLGKRLRDRTAAYVYWMHFAEKEVQSLVGNVSDGQAPGTADYAFSSFEASKTLIPDFYFFRDSGYGDVRQNIKTAPVSWQDRSDDIVWRGHITGEGIMTTSPSMQNHPGINQRLRMAVACKPLSIDFKFVGEQGRRLEPFLKTEGLMGDFVPVDFWASHKFAIDIDGFSNAWCNLFRRLLQGCCVLKVGSNFGFRQWYYHQLEPYVHYVPVQADLSDLAEQLDWVRSNDAKAREIAAQGQQLAQSLTWKSESKRAGQIITERWNA